MKILFLAPHPFYQERGTPIAVDLLLKTLSARGDTIELVTFHEGEEKQYAGVTIHRIPALPWVRNIRPGFSWKKLAGDVLLAFKALRLASRNRFQVVHAVEESVFIAMVIRFLFGVPYVFDMDSSMPMQIIEKMPALSVAAPFLRFFEALAARKSRAVVAVCDALADIARAGGARQVFVLRDISLLPAGYAPLAPPTAAAALPEVEHPCLIYIGNLEAYQGIDLMLKSFAALLKSEPRACLEIIGGNEKTIAQYRRQCADLGIAPRVRFFGPRPPADMARFFTRADILISPRVKGVNTPMKIYSYLQSGKPVLATDLPTHTQVLDGATALLAAPEPEAFAAAMLELVRNPALGRQLAERAAALAGEKYSWRAYQHTALQIYQQIENDVKRMSADAQRH
ncbi:MAG: glycosyltransferase family 4 protein [Kiritimatiellae bacterium]|nr:glycosyltransferase family 4 protein [Kiritimatiellia bacterium]